jgi:hypothetical protein
MFTVLAIATLIFAVLCAVDTVREIRWTISR